MIGHVRSVAPSTGIGLSLSLILLVGSGADQFRPAPKFTGRAIPDPPRQRDPWTPPATKLPRFLTNATTALFEAGMADPRGGEYREVEVGDAGLVKTRGFVLPGRPGEADRFVVGWDGVVYPTFSIGAAADLEADVRTLAEALRKGRQEAKGPRLDRYGQAGGFVSGGRYVGLFYGGPGPAIVESRSPLKLCLLLRLGRADLAEALFAAATTWTTDGPRPDLTDYHITYLTLANEWAGVVYARLVAAHARGDDVVALDAARRLDGFRKAVEAKAEAMGFQRADANQLRGPGPAPYLRSLDLLPALLADQERRAKEPPRDPVPPRGGDPSARVAALIRDLDQVRGGMMMNGDAGPGGDPIARELAAEGDAAIGPLLKALEEDTRLTRCVSYGRNGGPTLVHPVTDVAYSALRSTLKTSTIPIGGSLDITTAEGRKGTAAAYRAFWERNRGVPLVERWYRDLRDDSAGSARWLEAAAGMIQPREYDSPPYASFASDARPSRPDELPAMKGEPYRSKRDPSISDLMARRAAEIARSEGRPSAGLYQASQMALSLNRWDEQASLPTLRALRTASFEKSPNDSGRFIAQSTLLLVRAGDRSALDAYAIWIKAIRPKEIEHSAMEVLKPLWTYPDYPAIAAATKWMFTDPKSPWLPLVPREQGQRYFTFEDPIASPLICLPWFREAVLATLADKAKVGTASPAESGAIPYRMDWGISSSFGGSPPRIIEPEDRPRAETPIRACDWAAWKVSELEGAPECQPYWPDARRDAAVAAAADYIRRYGRRFAAEAPQGENDFPHPKAHLRFPSLGRPATAEDVREARAIFSIDGEGESRVVPILGGFPLRARWATLTAFPIEQQVSFVDKEGSHIQTRREYLRDGWVWQAEEVRKGDLWERFYGFVGHATIARVPASEIEFPAERFGGAIPPNGLEARFLLANPSRTPYPPGKPIVATLRVRNARGVERPVPTEFVRPGDDGKPALRRGVALALYAYPKNPDGRGFFASGPGEERKPTRAARFAPGGASRTLAPTESFDAASLDLNDWFAPLGPGSYRCHLTFAADSGLGEGMSSDVYFTIGGPEDAPR